MSDGEDGKAVRPEQQPSHDGIAQEQFSVFTVNQKRAIVSVGSLAALFSPFSSSSYFPALDTIASALSVPTSHINLTVTTYLVSDAVDVRFVTHTAKLWSSKIMQGVAPMLIAGFSDTAGRRPAYIICFTIYLAANLGLGLQKSYPALLVLRCVQSAGSSGTVALANGLVGDMVSSAENEVPTLRLLLSQAYWALRYPL